LQVAQEELAQDEQLLVAPLPPMSGDEEWTAKRESRRRTSPDEHCGHAGLVPLRINSSKGVAHLLQMNS
jgi:hypothetical protein